MISQRGPTTLEHHVYMGDSSRSKEDIMGIIKLKLDTRYVLELQEVSYVPSIRRNLLSISLLDSQGYSFCLEITKLKCIRMVKWLVLEPYVAIYIDLIYLIMVSIILLILLLLLLFLLNAQELNVMA